MATETEQQAKLMDVKERLQMFRALVKHAAKPRGRATRGWIDKHIGILAELLADVESVLPGETLPPLGKK